MRGNIIINCHHQLDDGYRLYLGWALVSIDKEAKEKRFVGGTMILFISSDGKVESFHYRNFILLYLRYHLKFVMMWQYIHH
jgi:hypothetical protein